MLRSLIVFLALGAWVASAHPARMFPNWRRSLKKEAVATVDCSDREAVKFVLQSHSNFRCLPGTKKSLAELQGIRRLLRKFNARKFSRNARPFANSLNSEDSVHFDNKKSRVACPHGKVLHPILKRCVYPNHNRPSAFTAPKRSSSPFPDGLESASLVRVSETNCEPGFLFSPDVNLCLAAHKPLNPLPLESDSLVADNPVLEIQSFNDGPNSADDCPPGTLFNSELHICSEISSSISSKPLSSLNLVRDDQPLANLEIRSFAGKVHSAADCQPGEIYAADVNLCVDRSPRPARSSRPESASLVRSRPTNPPLVTGRDCKSNEIYLSEVGICVKIRGGRTRRPSSDSLVRSTPAPVVPRVAMKETVTCKPGETFNPSINACLPFSPSHNKPTPPSSSSLVKEPVHLEIESSLDTVTADDCALQGKIFVGELGLCM